MTPATDPGVYEVSLDSCPPRMSEGYERNRQWNVRTLNLMAWAGMIRLRAPQAPERAHDEPIAEWAARQEPSTPARAHAWRYGSSTAPRTCGLLA